MAPATIRNKVFVSYSHLDEEWLKRLLVHLKPLERRGSVERWDDTRIVPGQKWKFEIKQAIDSAIVAVLLISADFLASDFIDKDEVPPLLSAAEQDGTVILPLIVSPCRFKETESLSQFQAVNPPSEPLIRMSKADQEQTLVNLTNRIAQVLDERSKSKATKNEPVEEEVTEESVFHPPKKSATRGDLRQCQFYISPFYHKTKLWRQLADVLVELRNPLQTEEAYLIPSGLANPHLRDARFLRGDDGKEWLQRKREATSRFIKQSTNRVMEGKWFTMKTKTGERTKVYSLEYDKFLNAALDDVGTDAQQ